MREIGISPDIILCRCENALSEEFKAKISLFCNVPQDAVIDEKDVEHSIYEVPLELHRQGLDAMVCKMLDLKSATPDLSRWEKMLHTVLNPKGKVIVGIVGKYMDHQDAYKSVFESLHHGAIAAGVGLEIRRFESDRIVETAPSKKRSAAATATSSRAALENAAGKEKSSLPAIAARIKSPISASASACR